MHGLAQMVMHVQVPGWDWKIKPDICLFKYYAPSTNTSSFAHCMETKVHSLHSTAMLCRLPLFRMHDESEVPYLIRLHCAPITGSDCFATFQPRIQRATGHAQLGCLLW